MKCKHMHKDAPENSVCEECHWKETMRFVTEVHKEAYLAVRGRLKGGKNDRRTSNR